MSTTSLPMPAAGSQTAPSVRLRWYSESFPIPVGGLSSRARVLDSAARLAARLKQRLQSPGLIRYRFYDTGATMSGRDAREQFREAIRAAGLTPPDQIEADGVLHRFPSNGDARDDAGWYVLHEDGIAAGKFGCWRSGISEKWYAHIGRKLTPNEKAEHQRREESMRQIQKVDRATRHAEAATKAQRIWENAEPAGADHEYLKRKGVNPRGIRVHEGSLVIPMRDGGTLHSLQFIRPDGTKRFLMGGRKSGCYCLIGSPTDVVCVAEGFATSAAIHEATGHAVAIAFDAGNLALVARSLRAEHPNVRFILCADDDAATDGNPGITKAREAAIAVGALLAVPDFGEKRPDHATDFNDLAATRGADAVRASIAMAAAPARAAEVSAAPAPVDILREFTAPALDPRDFPPIIGRYATLHARAAGHDVTAYLMAMATVAAAACDDSIRVQVDARTGWFESARLWALLIGPPGTAKSPAIRTAMQPVYAVHSDQIAAWLKAVEQTESEAPKPPRPAIFTGDATIEALSEILQHNERGLLVCTDELDAWLGQHDAYRGGQGSKDRGEWLRLFDGGPHQIDRIKRGSVFVRNWSAGILSATTPVGLARHAGNLPTDGLIQRFVAVMVRPMTVPDESVGDFELTAARRAFEDRIADLYAATGARIVQLSTEAASAFYDRRAELRGETSAIAGVSEALAGHIAKHPALIARLALTFHAIETLGHPADAEIHGETMQRALRVVRRLTRHAASMFAALAGTEDSLALARAVARTILADRLATLTRNDLLQRCRPYRDSDDRGRDSALRLLIDADWLLPDELARLYAGRTSRWIVDARVHDLFGEHGDEHRKRRAIMRDILSGHSDD